MSMDTCAHCGTIIDTDMNPDVYREDLNNMCICDLCMDILDDQSLYGVTKLDNANL